MNLSSPPLSRYGSTKQKNKQDKIGGRTIIDIYSCLDIAFVFLWTFSICARPTLVSTIHLFLFVIYVILGGITLYETSAKNISHPPVRYGIDSMIMIMIAIYSSIVAGVQVIIQILIAAGVMDGSNDKLETFGFHEPIHKYEWFLYLTLDLILCISAILLAYAHKRRNNKYRISRLNIINIEKVLISTSKSLPIMDNIDHHSQRLSIISSDEEESDVWDRDIEHSINSISTQHTMLISGAKMAKLSLPYTVFTSCLLLIISIAAPSILHIPYFLVVLLVSLQPILSLWSQTKPMFHMLGPIYMGLQLIFISLYQIPAMQKEVNDTTASILGLVDLHKRYWSYDEFIDNQHIVPNLVATVFTIVLLYALGLRPILLHSSIYKPTPPSQESLRTKSLASSPRKSLASLGNFLSPPQTRRKAKSTSMLRQKSSGSKSKKKGSYQSLPENESDPSSELTTESKENTESGIKKFVPQKQGGISGLEEENRVERVDSKHENEPLEIINESATQMISDRRSTILGTIFYRLSAAEFEDDIKEEKEQKMNVNIKAERVRAFSRIQPVITTKKKSKKRAKTVSALQSTDMAGTDSDTDSNDETMITIARQESLKILRKEQMTRKKLSMASMRSIPSVMSIKTEKELTHSNENVFVKNVKWFLHCLERLIESMGEWFAFRFFLWGPLICQLVCLWACFPHQDAFFIIILSWAYLSLFLLSRYFQTRDGFKIGVICILVYSMCAAFVKYVSYIPKLYDSNSSEWFAFFGMKDYGDLNGSYMFVASVPFLITSAYLSIQSLYRLISATKIVQYLDMKNKSNKQRRKDIREMKKIAALYPQNFESIMSKRGGTVLHACVDFRSVAMINIVAPFIDVNARDMYGRTALSQARKIHRYSTDKEEIDVMKDIIAGLWRVGCLRNKQMKWYSKFWQYLGMTGNYLAAAFYVMIEKVILFAVYVISTERADIIHLIFLVYFLIFLALGPLAHRYWWTLVLYNGMVITLRYVFNVFDIQPSDMVANDMGLRPPHENTGLIYPAILLSFVILHYHLTRKRRERHTLLEFKFEQLILKNTVRRPNSLLFAILYYLFYMIRDNCLLLVYVALIIIGLIKIHSINMGYCVCVFFCFFFHCWFKDPWKKIRAYWILIVAYCALCFFGLYASQYSFIYDWLKNDLYPASFAHKYFSLADIGLTNDDYDNEKQFSMFMALLGPVIAMILTVVQFSYFVVNKAHQEVKSNYYVTKLSRICTQILWLGALHCEKLTLLATFVWCIYRVNLISLSYVAIICIALINRITLRTAWCPFQIIAVIVFILKYCYQFHYFEDESSQYTNARVIGFERFGQSNGNAPVDVSMGTIWNGLGQELTIIILSTLQCILQWWIRMKPKYAAVEDQKPVIVWKHDRIYYEDLLLMRPREKSYTYKDDANDDAYDALLMHNNQIDLKVDMYSSNEPESSMVDSGRESSQSRVNRSMSQAALLSALRFTKLTWTICFRCLWRIVRRIWHILTNVFYFYGVELTIIVMVFASFFRNYSFSFVFMFFTACYIYDSRRNGDKDYKQWKVLRCIWWLLWVVMTLWFLLQYWVVIPYEMEHIIGECCGSRWWKFFHLDYNFAASQYYQWWSWVAFINYRAQDLFFDFVVLTLISLQRTNFIQHDKDQKRINGNKSIRTQLTLTKRMKVKGEVDENADILWESIKLQCLIYSDKILLLLMFIFGILNVDLLSIVFLLFPFFELFFSDSTNKQQLLYWWHYVQVYNYSVLALFTIYQLPAIPAESLDFPFISWQNIVGLYKIYNNGNYHCHDQPCTNIFENSSIIHNIVLLVIIDLQIKIITSKAYENGVIATYKEWKLFSQYRCFHSALMMKFKRLSQIDFFQKEKQTVQFALEELFSDEKLHDKLAFSDEELTFYPRLEGELANKAEQEERLYKRNIKGQHSELDPDVRTVSSHKKLQSLGLEFEKFINMDSSSESEQELKNEVSGDRDGQDTAEGDVQPQKEEEKLFVPYEEGLCLLIDKDFFVINTLATNERYVKVMQFFDGGNEIPWHRYLRHLYKNKEEEPFVADFIISQEEVHETEFNEDGDEIKKCYIKQYTESVAIMLKDPECARDFDTKAIIPLDAVACVVILPECSKMEALQFKIGVGFSNFWIWFRMFLINFVDTSMYCSSMNLMREITTIRKQLNAIDDKQRDPNAESCTSADLRAYYESQQELLQNVPQPTEEQLNYYASLQTYYKDKQDRKRKRKERKRKKKQEKKQCIAVNKDKQPQLLAKSSSLSTSISPFKSKVPTYDTSEELSTHESYFERRTFAKLIDEKHSLQKRLSYITSKLVFASLKEKYSDDDDEKDSKKSKDLNPECDNLLKMAVEIQSLTLDYLNSLSFASLFGAVVLSHTQELAVLCFFVTLLAHATILYSIVPISFLIYGLLQLPRPDQQFWLWIAAYTQICMVLKFLYQLDIFCVAQSTNEAQQTYDYYNIQPSFYCNNLNAAQIRFDQILGITKSEHNNDAVSVLIADIVCLIFVAVHIMMLKKKGVWHETEHNYDNYIELWFKAYMKRQYMYKQLEKRQQPAKNSLFRYDKINEDEIEDIKRIGEPKRVYDRSKDEFIENNIDYQSWYINKNRTEYVGLPAWDLWMFKFHSVIQKFLPFEIRMYFFELIPPSFRILASSESICDEIKPGIDLYFWMFLIDIVLLIWVLLFYQQMAEPQSIDSVTGGFSTSRFSGDMVLILFVQMCFMILDRIVYLTNTLILKLLCQIASVIVFHWLIYVKWILVTNQFFYDNFFLVTYYLLRLVYWFLSCKQIAYGYPTFIRSHSAMSKKFTFFYYMFFTIYMAIPFVYEMRTILEWVCVPTTLQLIELMKVEDIYGQLFKIKCNMAVYKQQRNRGEQIPMLKKFFQGGCVFIAIVAFLIVPLLLFSTASPASGKNSVTESSVQFTIMNINGFGNLDLLSLSNYKISNNNDVQVPLDLRPFYDATSQIAQSIEFESDADSIFTVPTVLRDRVSEILACLNATNGQPLTPEQCEHQLHGTQIEMKYEFKRGGPDDNNPISGVVYLNTDDLSQEQGLELSQVLNSSNQDITSFLCPTPYLEWLRLQAQGDVVVYNLIANPRDNVTLSLTSQNMESYWSISPDLQFILISDNFVNSSFLALTGISSYSVIGFYVIVVYSFAQLLRLLYGDQVKEIIFQDLQNVDYILRIVTSVKLARNQRNYHLEELLYRKLIRIYRDPSLIVTLTKRLTSQEQNQQTVFKDVSSNDSDNSDTKSVLRRRGKSKTSINDNDQEDYVPPIQSNIT